MKITTEMIEEIFKRKEEEITKVVRQNFLTPAELTALKNKIKVEIVVNFPELYMKFIAQENETDEFERQLTFLLRGSKKHWVSLKHQLVLDWALKTNLIYLGDDGYYRFTNSHKKTRAIPVSNTRQIDDLLEIAEKMFQIKLVEFIKEIKAIAKQK